jgi:general stress protein 26
MNQITPPTIEELLGGETVVILATAEGNQPRVRPVTLVNNHGELFLLTGTNSRKVDQLKSNNNVEIVKLVEVGEHTGYVRLVAQATIVEDETLRKRLADETSFFSSYWPNSKDPSYTLIRFHITKLAYLKPDEMEEEIITGFHLADG